MGHVRQSVALGKAEFSWENYYAVTFFKVSHCFLFKKLSFLLTAGPWFKSRDPLNKSFLKNSRSLRSMR